MDRQLKVVLSESAKNFLARSPDFEPYIPQSQQNSIQALQLLEGLAELTLSSLNSKKLILEALDTKQPVPAQSTLMSAQNPISTPTPVLGQVSGTVPTQFNQSGVQRSHEDLALLQELLRAQEARPTVRKNSAILRPNVPSQVPQA